MLSLSSSIPKGGGLIDTLKKSITGLTDGSSGILEKIKTFFGGLGEALESFTMNGKGTLIKSVATSMIMLAGAMLIMASIPEDKLIACTGAVILLIKNMTSCIPSLSKIGKSKSDFIKMAAAILILAFAMKTLASLDTEGLILGFAVVSALMVELVGVAKAMSAGETTFKSMKTKGLLTFAATIWILCQSVKDLASLDPDSMASGLVGVSALMWELVAISEIMQKNQTKFTGAGVGLVPLGAAVKILASVVKDLASLSFDELATGTVGIAGIMLLVAAFAQLTKGIDSKKMLAASTSMVIIGAGMLVMASAIKKLGRMKPETLVKGLIGLAGALTAIVVAFNLMPDDMLAKSAGLLIAAAALNMLDNVITNLGNMQWDSIGKALLALGGSLVILAVALNLMNGTVAGAGALMVAAIAIGMLTVPLVTLSNLSLEGVLTALVALAGAFVVLGVAGLALGPVVPVLTSLGISMLALGAGATLLGAGLLMIGLACVSLTASLVTAVASVLEAFRLILVDLPGLIPDILNVLKETIVGICALVVECAPDLADAAITLIRSMIKSTNTTVPELVDGALDLLIALLQGINERGPQIVGLLLEALINLIDGVNEKIQPLVDSGLELVVNTIDAIITKLKDLGWDNLDKVIEDVGKFALFYGAIIAVNATFPAAFMGLLKMGVIAAELTAILAAFGGLNQIPGLSWLLEEGETYLRTLVVR